MTSLDALLIVLAVVLVILGGLVAGAEAAISAMSRVRAEELLHEHRRGAGRLLEVASDAPRYLNSALLLRVMCETAAVVMVALVIADGVSPTWAEIVVAVAIMVVVSYVVVGVGPRTIGRQHSERVALAAAAPVAALAAVLGPIPQLLIVVGNAITPGRGFREGPFASEAELRELVDLAAQSQLIESDESKMIHSVFELGDTLVREVMVPRTDIVFIERHKTLRQMMSLALRSGFSRIPVIGDNLDDVVGIAYLKDVTRRVFDRHEAESTERIETVMRPSFFIPDSKPADDLMRDMQARRTHLAIVVDEYGGTAGLVTIEDLLEEIVGEITDEYDTEPVEAERLANGSVRVSSRLPIDDLAEMFDVEIEEDDVETVGGLMAKHLGRVPIPGAEVVCEGLRFRADSLAGRRNRVVSVVVSSEPAPSPAEARAAGSSATGGPDAEPADAGRDG